MKRILSPLFVLLLIAIAAGCQLTGSDAVSPVSDTTADAESAIDLDSPTGGYTEGDELVAFGEPEQYEAMGQEPLYGDPMQNENSVQAMERHRNVKRYRLRAVWGRLANTVVDSTITDCCPLDWTGGMHIDGGAIVIERLIAFDPRDYITRIDRSTIEWVSHTCPHVDGIMVRIIVPPSALDSLGNELAPATLTFKTGPFSRTFTIDELEALELFQPVDRCGNGIMIASHVVTPECPHGYLLGDFRKTEPDTIVNTYTGEQRGIVLGRFHGIWINEAGWMAGYLRGHFGINSAGERIFFGKYIGLRGEFKGILRGHYGYSPSVTSVAELISSGWFEGEWYGRNTAPAGRLKGEWVTGEDGRGFFKGIWGMNCSNSL